jgi:hypothetical protein
LVFAALLPDLSAIEQAFAKIKHWMRRAQTAVFTVRRLLALDRLGAGYQRVQVVWNINLHLDPGE